MQFWFAEFVIGFRADLLPHNIYAYLVAFGRLALASVAIVVLDECVDDIALHLVDGGALVAALQPFLIFRQHEQLLQFTLRR